MSPLAALIASVSLAVVAAGVVVVVLAVLRRLARSVARWRDRRRALERAWRALLPVYRSPHPTAEEAARARLILRRAEDLRRPSTADFVDLLQGSLLARLGGEPGVDPAWLDARLEETATRLFPAWRSWPEAALPPDRASGPGHDSTPGETGVESEERTSRPPQE